MRANGGDIWPVAGSPTVHFGIEEQRPLCLLYLSPVQHQLGSDDTGLRGAGGRQNPGRIGCELVLLGQHTLYRVRKSRVSGSIEDYIAHRHLALQRLVAAPPIMLAAARLHMWSTGMAGGNGIRSPRSLWCMANIFLAGTG